MLQDAGRKTSRQGVARQSQYLPHVAQAHARQGSGCFAAQADALQRHLLQGAAQLVWAFDAQPVMHIGEHPRRDRVGRDHNAMPKALRGQFFTQARLEHRPRPEQFEAGLDFHQQHPRVLEADTGAEPVRPGGEQLLQVLGVGGVVDDRGEVGHQCLRRRQRLPGPQAQCPRSRVDGLQDAPMRAAADQCQRFIGITATTHDAVERQLRQQDTGPQHKNLKRRSGME